jgi:hypothetical protein
MLMKLSVVPTLFQASDPSINFGNECINNTAVNPSRINNNPKFALRSCVLNIAVSKF